MTEPTILVCTFILILSIAFAVFAITAYRHVLNEPDFGDLRIAKNGLNQYLVQDYDGYMWMDSTEPATLRATKRHFKTKVAAEQRRRLENLRIPVEID